MQGMKLSYRLHKLLQSSSDSGPVRGMRLTDNTEMSVASNLYLLVRGSRANRRYLLTTLLKMFEDDSVCYVMDCSHAEMIILIIMKLVEVVSCSYRY